MTTAAEVARWMLAQLNEEEYLYQHYVVAEIEERFGEAFIYYNANGNPAVFQGSFERIPQPHWRRRDLESR
ncbi:hypothetical protein FHS01_005550 [Longimicrobium terrae]|uniref:Uncharacterized protein n=1 Tax=Longimicrobium terrae TaxID=1639882 RepID=A0A841H6X0_9BACT|nr:hypothetical protein [Longimicrobium terrae]MBB4639475.1 hypothetical protein [Longimicrobium terrae]MBB6073847.1 hypothetical protein [Longimicrobium terrae]